MSKEFKDYLLFLESLGKTLEELTTIAKEKTQAVRADDLPRLDACIKKEQALSLTLRSMDRKRDTLLAQMGLAGVSLSNLPIHYPAELQPAAKSRTDSLSAQYQIFLSASETARTTLECNLHQIERLLDGDETPSSPPPQPPEAMKANIWA